MCVCVCVCVRACMHACMRARVCVCICRTGYIRSLLHIFPNSSGYLNQSTGGKFGADFDTLNSALEDSLPPRVVLGGGDVNSTWPLFYTAFMDTAHKLIPCKDVEGSVSPSCNTPLMYHNDLF